MLVLGDRGQSDTNNAPGPKTVGGGPSVDQLEQQCLRGRFAFHSKLAGKTDIFGTTDDVRRRRHLTRMSVDGCGVLGAANICFLLRKAGLSLALGRRGMHPNVGSFLFVQNSISTSIATIY